MSLASKSSVDRVLLIRLGRWGEAHQDSGAVFWALQTMNHMRNWKVCYFFQIGGSIGMSSFVISNRSDAEPLRCPREVRPDCAMQV